MESLSPNVILDNLGALVSTLKEKNELVEIYVCELVTIFDDREYEPRIKDYNKKLIEWSSDNNINIIKTDLPFRLGTGETDEMCFEFREEIKDRVLNRYDGVIRLLDTVVKQYPDISDSINIAEMKRENVIFIKKDYQKPKIQIRDTQRDSYTYNHRQNNHQLPYRPNTLGYFHHRFDYNGNLSQESSTGYRESRFNSRSPQQQRRYEQAHEYHWNSDRRRGCYNCGEFNHQQSSCRYNNRVRCENCGDYGHKRRLCQMHQSR